MALNNLAWVYQQKGDDAARPGAGQAGLCAVARRADGRYARLDPDHLGRRRDRRALLRQATGEAASDPRINYHYAVALKDTGDKAEAKKQLETVVAASGDFKEKAEAQKVLDELSKG